MNLKAISDYLAQQGLGVAGQTIFRRKMPARVDKGLLVIQQQAAEINPYARQYYRGSFQVIARAKSYDEARDLANSVIDAIEGYGQQLDDMKFRYILARHLPLLYPKSDSDLVEASVNFDCVFST